VAADPQVHLVEDGDEVFLADVGTSVVAVGGFEGIGDGLAVVEGEDVEEVGADGVFDFFLEGFGGIGDGGLAERLFSGEGHDVGFYCFIGCRRLLALFYLYLVTFFNFVATNSKTQL